SLPTRKVARVSRSDFRVSPFATVVTTPHMTAHEPPRDRPPRYRDPPQMPEARPFRRCFRRNASVDRYGPVSFAAVRVPDLQTAQCPRSAVEMKGHVGRSRIKSVLC